MPHAASVERLTARCFACGGAAPYTLRLAGAGPSQGAAASAARGASGAGSGANAVEGQVELVGGADRYRPACAACYRRWTPAAAGAAAASGASGAALP